MIADAHKQHVLNALRKIHECATIDINDKVSYTVKPGYAVAMQILSALTGSLQSDSTLASKYLSRALDNHSKLTAPDLSEFIRRIWLTHP